jgi:hypothetical protein
VTASAAGLAVHNLATHEDRSFVGPDQQEIGLIFVDFRFSRAVAVGNECGIHQSLRSEMSRRIQCCESFLIEILLLLNARSTVPSLRRF